MQGVKQAKPFNPQRWNHFYASPTLVMQQRKLLSKDSKVFAIGSCFAMEIRNALARRNVQVYPNYLDVRYDPKTQIFDKIPERDFIAHYDTFVIRQEFEAALGVWQDRDAGFWPVEDSHANKMLGARTVYQEPYRKMTYASSVEHLKDLSDKITDVMRRGIEEADLIVITLGLTEVWQHNTTGRYLCRPPNTGYGGGLGLATFRQSTFAENYANMRAVFDLLGERFPGKQIVLTVSPVPLQDTYSETDIGTANLESKSILRAVAGQICREYENVTYFPSYEMAHLMGWPVFQEDGRHVLGEFADRVVAGFLQVFSDI